MTQYFQLQGSFFDAAAQSEFAHLVAHQQPDWPNRKALATKLASLSSDGLVSEHSVQALRTELAQLGKDGLILQLGDCVEDLELDVRADTLKKLRFIDAGRTQLGARTGKSVTAIGRIAGQYAKPRSVDTEQIDGLQLPVYRGPIVNSAEPTMEARLPDVGRIERAHVALRVAHRVVADYNRTSGENGHVWTSHEMLLLDYELRFLARGSRGRHLATTHWPWIGARTRQLGGAHVAVAARLSNPVSVKIGPDTDPTEAVALVRKLNPLDEPSKLAFVIRMGFEQIGKLRPIVRAVRREFENVLWISDPMHGNTVKARSGLKTRHLAHIISELQDFQKILQEEKLIASGLHLEATPDDVYECADDFVEPDATHRYTSLLDPRLNPEQTARVLDSWFV
ncbi:3-deoxy-7-phosphoheptulonate synthase [Rhizobium sp. 007]|uniref:3-deoxy-7-phosphoheptulonate synthase n=1 Tax=Rhizobium sp. 007 TaxID=2785056 RepID=UPI0018904ACC|nr:3-deoxy-7-phosphoheptulonate synthase [Rhizobium sp. 007]QPB24306.1 3-deoxy-7-phosphoheptulonate synthase [Rhizobium sp. 007]